jgi:hypothetical protein
MSQTELTLDLPLEEAVVAAARQNRDYDRKIGEFGVPWKLYLEEARYILNLTGENWVPGSPDLPLIRVKRDNP